MLWFIRFSLGYIFPFALSTMGISACLIIFGIVILLNAMFCMTYIPETRGKSYEEIQKLLLQ